VDTKDQWFARIKDECARTGTSPRDYTAAVRLALTGRENTPDLYAITQILCETEVLKRLKQ
jgi:glutamyl/glutaminyl-tRNA synthetase